MNSKILLLGTVFLLIPLTRAFSLGFSDNDSDILWIILLLLLLFAIILFLKNKVSGESGSGSKSGTDGKSGKDGKSRTDGKEGRDKEERFDFNEILDKISELLRQYEEEFNRFKNYCKDVLQTHHDHMNSDGSSSIGGGNANPPVSSEQWQRLFDSLERLRNLDNQINSLLNSITSHKDFSRIIPEQRQRLMNLSAERTDKVSEMQTFYADFWTRYNNADPPLP